MHLLRTLDIEDNSNMAVLGMAIVGFVVGLGLGVTGDDFGAALLDAANLGLSIFLAWAVARELDPDGPGTAILAGFLGGGLWLLMDRSALAATVAALLAARILVRSTGRPPSNVDFVVCIVLAWYASRTVAGWVAGLGLAYALARDVRLPGRALKHQRPVAFLVAGASTIGALMRFPEVDPAWSLLAIMVVVAGIVAGLRLPPTRPRSLPDHGDVPLAEARLLSARRVAVVVAIFGAITGTTGVAHLSPVWAAIIAVPLHEFLRSGSRRARSGAADDVDNQHSGPAAARPAPTDPPSTTAPAPPPPSTEAPNPSPPPPAPPPRPADPPRPPPPTPTDGGPGSA